jgi:hypothetical protein
MKKIVSLIALMTCTLGSFAQSMVAHYDFTNTGVTGVATEPVNGLTGIATNCVPASGKCGVPNTAIKFNGLNSVVTVNPDVKLNLTAWTIQAIVYIDGFETNLDCQVSKILQHGTQYGTNYYALEINDNNDDPQDGPLNNCASPVDTNNMNFYGAPAGTITPVGQPVGAALHTGQWYCLTATYNREAIKYYINGALVFTKLWPNQYNYGTAPNINVVPLLIGSGTGQGGTTYWFNGIMDDIRIYNYEMPASQVAGICDTCAKPPKKCMVNDIGYCSALSTPYQYTFTPTVTPSTSNVRWTIDAVVVAPSVPATAFNYNFAGAAGTHHIMLEVLDAQGQPCASRAFDMCLDPGVGAKSNNGIIPADETGTTGALYPNPANTILNVPMQGINGTVNMSVTAADGMVVHTYNNILSEGKTVQLNIADLKPGVYMLQINTGKEKLAKRFSKL